MKRLLALALCALFACQAEARTIYVNAKRPNNKGNGLSVKKAKKTIQAAINIARKGDTILVYPGTYAPIKTNNKKIAIKSTKGRKKTKIVANEQQDFIVDLSKHVQKHNAQYDYTDYTGNSTRLSGFLLDGRNQWHTIYNGTLGSCKIRRILPSVYNSKLSDCILSGINFMDTNGISLDNCTATRCKIQKNSSATLFNSRLDGCIVSENGSTSLNDSRMDNCTVSGNAKLWLSGSTLANCLVSDNSQSYGIADSTLVNCTIAKNSFRTWSEDEKVSVNSKFFNCILWNNYSQSKWGEVETVNGDGPHEEYGYFDQGGAWVRDEWGEDGGYYDQGGTWIDYDYQYRTVSGPYTTEEWVERTGPKKLHNVDAGNVYKNTDKTNKNPKFVSAAKGNYKLKKGSYCINKGKLTKAQKKLVGKTDLAGNKRIRGKAIDIGCYEY